MRRLGGIGTIALALAVAAPILARQPAAPQAGHASHVLIVTIDGMRWQEVFGGLQPAILDDRKASGVEHPEPLTRRFGGATDSDRRTKLLPFLWTVIARDGQVFGDPSHGSDASATNGLWFSYPGYNELFAGFPDPRVDSNHPVYNPNVTVLEWLNHRPAFAGRVAAFASWDLLPWILNAPRSRIPCNAAVPPIAQPSTGYDRAIDDLSADLPPYWSDERFDGPTGFGAIAYLRRAHPRVLYVMLGETDDWAHERRYDLYLDAAARNDRFIRRLWEAAQSLPEYAGRTALVVTTDHGRGPGLQDWTDHGQKIPDARRIWMAVMGPNVAPLGVRADVRVTQGQIAATIASLVGEDYRSAQPKAAAPLPLR